MNESLDFRKRQKILSNLKESEKKIKRVHSAKELQSFWKGKSTQNKFEANKENVKKIKQFEKYCMNQKLQQIQYDDYRTQDLKYFFNIF